LISIGPSHAMDAALTALSAPFCIIGTKRPLVQKFSEIPGQPASSVEIAVQKTSAFLELQKRLGPAGLGRRKQRHLFESERETFAESKVGRKTRHVNKIYPLI